MAGALYLMLLTSVVASTITACGHGWSLSSSKNARYESSADTPVAQLVASIPDGEIAAAGYGMSYANYLEWALAMEAAGELQGFTAMQKLEAGSLRSQGYDCRRYRDVWWRPIWDTAVTIATTDYTPVGCERVRPVMTRPLQDASLDDLMVAARA